MIFEHEIPSKSRLYFGAIAKKKRELEYKSSLFLQESGFEEIVTPLLSYHQHKSFEDSTKLIRLNDENNNELTLRADSTIDVVRILDKRLATTATHKRWFYIQPVITYPTQENYQVGAEIIDGNLQQSLSIAAKLLQELDVKPFIQVSNIMIPKILNKRYGISLKLFKSMEVEKLMDINYPWIKDLIRLQNIDEVDALVKKLPQDLAQELVKLKDSVESIEYDKIVLSPLYYAKMQYYEGLTFKAFVKNSIVARGGEYRDKDIQAAGFTINIDEILKDF